MSQVLKCHRCGGILHTNESDIIGCLLESLKRAESKLSQAEKMIEAQHAARAVLAGDINMDLARVAKEAEAERDSALGRLSSAVELLQQVLDGTAEPVDWNPRARAVRDGVVERQSDK